MNKPTVGSQASSLLSTTPNPINPQEIQRAQEQEYLDNLIWAVKHARKEVDCSKLENHEACKERSALTGDFFIAALLKKEKLLENVLRNYFVPTVTCPTPYYDQTVYRYNDAKGDVEFLWVIPDQETCEIFKENKNIIVPGERGLLQFVMDFYDGKLLQIAKRFNGESEFAGGLLKGN